MCYSANATIEKDATANASDDQVSDASEDDFSCTNTPAGTSFVFVYILDGSQTYVLERAPASRTFR